MSGLVRDGIEGLLCPNAINEPIAEAHRLRVRMLDAFYEASEKNDEGEVVEAAEVPYRAADERASDWMSMYEHTVFIGSTLTWVTTYWYRCGVCGLVLPATDVRRARDDR